MLLAALLLNAGRLVLTDQLAEVLWSGSPPPSARASLHNHVKRLRGALGEAGSRIRTEPGGYLAAVAAGELDAARAQSLLATARTAARDGDWEQASAQATATLLLWRGEPLAGLRSDVLAREIPHLDEIRLQLTETRLEAELQLGRPAEVINELWRLTAAHPLREGLHALLMLALYRSGRRAEALAAYQAARKTLIEELGSEPAPELQQLHKQILADDPALSTPPATTCTTPAPHRQPRADPGAPAAAPASRGSGTDTVPRQPNDSAWEVRSSLPLDTAAFTGRDAELALVSSAVAQVGQTSGGIVAILALSGMPGVGKTALAVHAAHLLASRFPDRRLFVDLHGHTPGREPVTADEALGVLLAEVGEDRRSLPEGAEAKAALWRDRMAGQRSLVVLDNAASSAQVAPLLPGNGGCLVLVTSRRRLADLPGVVIPVLVEVLPPDQAARMFTRLSPGAASWEPAQVAELVRLAGHLPLAISLLARVHARHPAWRADDLIGETRARLLTLSAEHASVAAAFDVSWAHLGPRQQSFLACLGLHPGATVDAWAAAALAEVPLEEAERLLDGLHGEGLVTETGHRRYGMHDLIRRYAIGRAEAAMSDAEREQAVGRLLDYYQHTAAMADAWLPRHAPPMVSRESAEPLLAVPELLSSEQALAWARAERTSVLACLDYAARTGQHARVVALTAGMAALLRLDGPWTEAIAHHADAVLAARELGDVLGEARALGSLGDVRAATGDHAAAARDVVASLDICCDLGDRAGQARALATLAEVRWLADDYPAAAQAAKEALSISRDLGDRASQARNLRILGNVNWAISDFSAAVQNLEASLDIYRDLGEEIEQVSALNALGVIWNYTGDYLAANRVLEASLRICREQGSRRGQANALHSLGAVHSYLGDYLAAAQYLEESLSICHDLGDTMGQAGALLYLSRVRRQAGDYLGAAQAVEAALDVFRDHGDRGGEAEALNETGALAHAQGENDRAAVLHRQALDLAREIDSTWDEAHALAGLGRCADDTVQAEDSLRRALEIFQRTGAVGEAARVGAELDTLAQIKHHPALPI
jgi:DNA-binding SARP family transcriptional activator